MQNTAEVPQRVTDMRKAWAEGDAKRDAGLKEPETLEKYRSLSYGPYGDWNLLDLYIPKVACTNDKASDPAPAFARRHLPVIVSIHGGGFFYGDKELYRFYCMHLAEFGFAVVNFNYRLAPENKFPAPVEDSFEVFEWIAENAEKYGLDTGNVFLTGDSAGAQLVSQVAAIASNPGYAGLFGLKLPEKFDIRAVSLACGLYILKPFRSDGKMNDTRIDYVGGPDKFLDPRIDVLANITGDFPPAFVFSSYCDFLYNACEPMAELINARGGSAECRIYGAKDRPDIAHVFHVNMRLEEGEKANRDQIDFFKKHIK